MVAVAAVAPVAPEEGRQLGARDRMITQVAAVGVLVVASEVQEQLPYAHTLLQELLGDQADIKEDLVELDDYDKDIAPAVGRAWRLAMELK